MKNKSSEKNKNTKTKVAKKPGFFDQIKAAFSFGNKKEAIKQKKVPVKVGVTSRTKSLAKAKKDGNKKTGSQKGNNLLRGGKVNQT